MKRRLRLLLVEDNPRYREALVLALQGEPDLSCCGQFGTAEIALRSLQGQPAAELPDVIVLDLRLPGMDGLAALPRFLAAAPHAKILVLTQSDGEADVLRAISQGASGYLLKSSTSSQIIDAVRSVLSGGASIDPRVARFILRTLQMPPPHSDSEPILTERQREILVLLGEGFVKKEIADRLGIGYATVDDHVTNIYARLGVRNAPAAVNRAHLLGLFPTGTPRSHDHSS